MPGGRGPVARAGPLTRLCGTLATACALAATPVERVGATRQPGRDVIVRQLAAGRLLVAARTLPDPNFAETVVLLIEYSRDGAAGLVLNRPSDVPLSQVIPGAGQTVGAEAPTFAGGPVSQASVLALSRTACQACPVVARDVYLVNTPDALKGLLAKGQDERRLRIYTGYAGWQGGQLDAEVRLGAWRVLEAEATIVFDAEPASLWRRMIARTEAVLARLLGPRARPAGTVPGLAVSRG